MNCKQCGSVLGANKRDDTLFCNQNCKQKHYKRRKKVTNGIDECQRKIKSEKDILKHWENILKKLKIDAENEKKKNLDRLAFLKVEIQEHYDALAMNPRNLFNFLLKEFKKNEDKFRAYLDVFKYGNNDEKLELMKSYRSNFRDRIKEFEKEMERLNAIKTINSFNRLFKSKQEIHAIERIEKSKQEILEIEKELERLEQIDLDRLPIIPTRIKNKEFKRVSSARAYGGNEIANLHFEYTQLKGELGKFLGKLERNKCAIALTGDSGAGKSTFSFSLADAFVDSGHSVGYFSLESGFTSKFKEFAKRHRSNDGFKAFEEGTLNDVRTEAKNFDCVIIDSFSKISQKAKDFEELRQDLPDTYFIIIFQKTTDGKIRGGSSILFNSTATIDVQIKKDGERIAVMKKSRYDTENFIYSLSNDTLIKDDKLPI